MNSRWQAVPDTAPFKCPLTQQSERADGPYLRTGIVFYPVVLDESGRPGPGRREEALFLSPQGLREVCELPGSPLIVISRDVWAALQERVLALEAENAELVERLGEVQEEVERFRKYSAAPLDAAALIDSLDARYQLRRGPKPKDKEPA